MGLMVAGSLLMGPSIPKLPASQANMQRERLQANLDVTAPRKILFGNTHGATDVRYQAFTGANQEYLEQIVCVAAHKVNSIYELWLENELAWSSAGGVVAKYSPFLTVTPINEGTSTNGIAIDSNWTANATLTGCAYFHAKYLLIRDNGEGGNDSPFASGVTSRMTPRTEGAFVYDPRLDSTVTGGSGAHRAGTQSTWAWNSNGSRNPALQLLFYLLGWRINGKLSVGMGLPAARIDLESFITAANACDESVTLAAGGTEPRYRSDGVLTEADDRTSVVEALCANMNAVLRDNGGKLSLHVLYNDLATPAGSFTENDVRGGLTWDQTPGINSSYNIVRGQRIDSSDEALYQPSDYAEVALASIDGIDRIASVNYPLCQSNGQAQRLAKQFLQRNQYQGRLSFVGKPAFWGLSLGDVFEFSHVAYGWTDKLFRCAGQKINRGGETEIIAVEEHSDIYQWDNDESPAVNPGTPTVYDSTNHPFQVGINAAMDDIYAISSDSVLDVSEKQQLIPEVESIIDEKPGIEAEANRYAITTEKTNYTNAYTALINYLNSLSPAWNNTAQNTTIVRATFNSKFEDYYLKRQTLLNKIYNVAGSTSVVLDPFSQIVIRANSDGTIKAEELPKRKALTASIGTANITTLGTWSRDVTTGITCTVGAATGIFEATGMTTNEVFVPVTFVYNGVTRQGQQHVVIKRDETTGDGSTGGTGGTQASTTTLFMTAGNTSAARAYSAVVTVKTGTNATITTTGTVYFERTPGDQIGATGAWGIWQWSAKGAGTWADFGPTLNDSQDAITEVESGFATNYAGSIGVGSSKSTGLAASTEYDVRFSWWRQDVSGFSDEVYKTDGTLTVTGS